MSKGISKMMLALGVAGSVALLAGTLACGSPDAEAPASEAPASESSASRAPASASRAAPGPGAMSEDPVHWTAEIDEESLAAGATVTVAVSATIDPGWYIYSITQERGRAGAEQDLPGYGPSNLSPWPAT